MKEKLELLMKSENLTAVKLAEILDIQPSRLSQIKAERNKQPSFDIVQKILRRFPRINPDWLILDSGEMYRPGQGPDTTDAPADLFTPSGQSDSGGKEPSTAGADAEVGEGTTSRELHISAEMPGWTEISNSRALSQVERIIIIYADGTFQDFSKR